MPYSDLPHPQVLSTAFLAGQGPPAGQSTKDWMWNGKDIASVWPDLAGEGAAAVSDGSLCSRCSVPPPQELCFVVTAPVCSLVLLVFHLHKTRLLA